MEVTVPLVSRNPKVLSKKKPRESGGDINAQLVCLIYTEKLPRCNMTHDY